MQLRVRPAVRMAALWRCGAALMLALALLGGLAPSPALGAQGRTWHVATTGSDTTGNGSPSSPFATIQHAIDASAAGDTVLAQPGVYRENIAFRGKDITVGSLFLTTGNEDYLLSTVIDGGRNGRVVIFVNGESSAARLTGLTLTRGYASGASQPDSDGGALYCSYASPTLTHLRVVHNEAANVGGGLHFEHCTPVIRNVYIANNRAGAGGGGIRYSYGSVDMENVVVLANTSGDGGGMHLYHADGDIRNALIADNVSTVKGGGVGFDGSSPTFTNVTIVGNRTLGGGGGFDVSYMSQPTVVNSIVWGNAPDQIDFDTRWFGQAITVEHTDLQGGQAGIVTNDLGPVHWGAGNLDLPPQFAGLSAGNYRLSDKSPAIGAGKADGAPAADIEGNPRPNPAGSNPDMGAYENALGVAEEPGGSKCYVPLVVRRPAVAPLLVRYDFEGDFMAAGKVLDRSGHGNDAQVKGAVGTTSGICGGQGISFGGGYIEAASNPAAGKTNVSFALWFKTGNPGENYKLASGAWWNWGPGSGWILATHIPEFWSDDGNGLYLPDLVNNDNAFPSNEWIHEVVTYDGSRIKEYTNGRLINDWATTGAPIGQGRPLAVGAWPMFSGYNFQGALDEFAIYDRSLTSAEVQALYRQGR